ncbi:MAG TPA: MFS transporter, partial [Reyranellaceae bacterium]|nr:MFS transporter [Reyranellaceae bacterium]
LAYGGITVMFGLGALLSPRIGRALDAGSPRLILTIGSLVYAAGLAAMAMCQGVMTYLLSWAVLGVASALALQPAGNIALAQVAGPRARQAIALLAILGGFASTIFWPIGGALEPLIGWRGTLLVYAAAHLAVCTPIHWLVLLRQAPVHDHAAAAASDSTARGGLPDALKSKAFLLLAVSFSLGAFVFTGMIVHAIEMLRGLGHAPAIALFVASLIGPAQVAVRFFELFFGHRYTVVRAAVVAAIILPAGLAVAMIGGHLLPFAVLCIAAYAVANGMKAVLRATLPLALFGRGQFGTYMGRLALPQGIVSAVAPMVLAGIMTRFGAMGAFWAVFIAALGAMVAMLLLARLK